MDKSFIICIILSIIIVTVIFLSIAWALTVQTVPTYTSAPQYTLAGYGGRCTTKTLISDQNRPDEYQLQKCGAGLACINGYCFKELGTKCNTLFECVPGTLVCNGHCSNTGKGGLDDVCTLNSDCDTNLSCNNNKCKKNIGTFCSINDNCVSNSYCNNSVCTLFTDPGKQCTINSCGSGFICSTSEPINGTGNYPSFCQPSNTANGLQRSYCSLWNDPNGQIVTDGGTYQYVDGLVAPSCATGYTCNIIRDSNGLTTSMNGFCTTTGFWDGNCNSDLACQNPQVCIQGRCKLPINDVLSCDRLNSTGICLNGYRCNNLNKCVGLNSNIPVVNSSDCQTSISNGRNIVWKYFDNSSWTNSGLYVPSSLDNIDSYNIYFTSFESQTGLTALLHQFESNSYYICSTTGYIECKISNNIVGNFTTNISYNNGFVQVNYIGSPDYVGYTTRGNYFTAVRYTVISTNYSSPPLTDPPIIQDFTRIYYDTLQDFSNNVLSFTSNGDPFYNYYFDDTTNRILKYVYSISVDDRIIDPNFLNSGRIYLVTNEQDKPINSVNEGDSQKSGVLVSVQINTNIFNNSSIYNIVSRSNFIINGGEPDYTITWCSAYIYRTINITNILKECYGRSNYDLGGKIRKYNSTYSAMYYIEDFPYETMEGDSKYPSSISLYSSKTFDLVKSSIAYIVKENNKYNLGSSKNKFDTIIAASVDNKTLLSVPHNSSSLDTLSYRPKILLYSKVCN